MASLDGPTRNCTIMSLLLKKKIIFSDRAHFHPGGYINKQNCHIWGSENPCFIYYEQLLGAACEAEATLVQSFFQNEDSANVTVNGDRFCTMLSDFFFVPALHGIYVSNVCCRLPQFSFHNPFIASNV